MADSTRQARANGRRDGDSLAKHKRDARVSGDAAAPVRRRRKRKWWQRKRVRRNCARVALCLVTVLLVALGGAYSLAAVVFRGPSPTASDLLVNSALETSALKFLPYLYFSESEVASAVARNSIVPTDEVTDASLVTIATPGDGVTTAEEVEDIEVIRITGATYKGVMMIVHDPSRVIVGVCNNPFSDDKSGKRIEKLAESYNAVAALNGGGFEDPNGTGNGGMPIGIVISEGQTLSRYGSAEYDVLSGFDENDKLIVGKMTIDQAHERGIRDAVQFGPALVINGEPSSLSGQGSGLNPRSAIGQRADGAVLLLAIDGRQVNSMGASLSDLIDVMLEYGAVNAANLDGGSSTMLYYNGEYMLDGTAVTGGRKICTAFIVK